MAKKKKWFPFAWTPTAWALSGDERQRQQIMYDYDGEDMERRLLDVNHKDDPDTHRLKNLELDVKYGKADQYKLDVTRAEIKHKDDKVARELALNSLQLKYNRIPKYEHDKMAATIKYANNEHQLKLEMLDIDFQHGKIGDYEYKKEKINLLVKDEKERKIAFLELDHVFGKIDELTYEKELATINGEPWVKVKESSFNPTKNTSGFRMVLDWNEHFVTMLIENGYRGATDEIIVQDWYHDLCKAIAYEEGGFDYMDQNYDDFNVPSSITRKRNNDNGTTEYL